MKNKKECFEIFKTLDLSGFKIAREPSPYHFLVMTLLTQEIESAKQPKLFSFDFAFAHATTGDKYFRVTTQEFMRKALKFHMDNKKIGSFTTSMDSKTNHNPTFVNKKIISEKDAIQFIQEFLRNDEVKTGLIQLAFELTRPFIEKSQLERQVIKSKKSNQAKLKV